MYKLLCDIELTRTRFVRVTSKSVGSGSSGSDGGNRPRREIDIIIILFFVWSVSQTSLCVYATTYVRTYMYYRLPRLSVIVFKSSSTVPLLLVDYPYSNTVIIIIKIIISSRTVRSLVIYCGVRLVLFFSLFFVFFCLVDNFTCETISSCSTARRHPYL